jgi:hypothetical protein
MNQAEWEAAYPPHKALHLPAPECRAEPEPLPTYAEACQVKDGIEMRDEHGGMLVVEWEGLFYVVCDEGYCHGFKPGEDYTPMW